MVTPLSLESMIKELGLTSLDINMFSVNDNASNMKLGIKMSHYLSEYNCDIHTLELVIKDSVTGSPNVVEVLKNTKAIAKYVNKSSPAAKELKTACDSEEILFKKPVIPLNT